MLAIDEINIVPVKPDRGKIAHASCVINGSLFLGSLAIYTKTNGGYRIVYPTKKLGDRGINVFHPINKPAAETIEKAIITEFKKVMNYEEKSKSGLCQSTK